MSRGSDAPPPRTVEIHPHGLSLIKESGEPEIVPLWVGAMHYWRHAPEHWAPA